MKPSVQQNLQRWFHYSLVCIFCYGVLRGLSSWHKDGSAPSQRARLIAPNGHASMKLAVDPFRIVNQLSRRKDWDGVDDDHKDMCEKLRRNPVPFNGSCRRNSASLRCTEGKHEYVMFSQFHQDYYLYANHFKRLTRPGLYVDIAANHPTVISNTYFFDRCLKWSGLCVEANYEFFEPLYRHRSCHIVPTCVGSVDNSVVDFRLDGGGGGILGKTYKSMHKLARAQKDKQLKSIPLRCTTMAKANGRNGITHIDYLSLDVEGHELEVLKGFGLDNVTVSVMSIEVTGSDVNDIEKFLTTKGYKRHYVKYNGLSGKILPGCLKEDAIFLHNSVEFGSP